MTPVVKTQTVRNHDNRGFNGLKCMIIVQAQGLQTRSRFDANPIEVLKFDC